jgi:hypothetical protein
MVNRGYIRELEFDLVFEIVPFEGLSDGQRTFVSNP